MTSEVLLVTRPGDMLLKHCFPMLPSLLPVPPVLSSASWLHQQSWHYFCLLALPARMGPEGPWTSPVCST